MGKYLKPSQRLLTVFFIGTLAFGIAAKVGGQDSHLALTFAAFLTFEFCCGVYFPSIGVLKSEVVPEHVRGTMYNIYRVPLNGLVVLLLLTDLKMTRVFIMCALCMCTAALSVGAIAFTSRKTVEDEIVTAKNV